MAGTIYSKFFWQDWLGEKGLKLCSMGARGTWMGLLSVAAESETHGHVLLAGKKPSLADLRQVMNCPPDFTDDDLQKHIDELISRGVCNLTREGVIVSRRMVRDEQKRRAKSKGGKKSAEVRGGIISGNPVSSNKSAEVPSTRVQSPSASSSARAPVGFEEQGRMANRLSEAMGWDITSTIRGAAFITQTIRMIDEDELDFEQDILVAVREIAARRGVPPDLRGMAFFRPLAVEKRDARRLVGAAAVARANVPVEPTDEDGWRRRLLSWLDYGYWPSKYGPRPRSGECLAPPHFIESALNRWKNQGGHPQNSFPADPNSTIRKWHELRDVRGDPNVDYGDGPLPGQNVVPFRAAQ